METKRLSSFEIADTIKKLQSQLEVEEFDQETGELIPNDSLVAELDKMSEFLDDKIDGIAYHYKEISGRLDTLKKERTRIQKIEARLKRELEQLDYLVTILVTEDNGFKYETALNEVKKTNSEAIIINDESKVPSDYIRYEPKVMRAELKKAIKTGIVEANDDIYINRTSRAKLKI